MPNRRAAFSCRPFVSARLCQSEQPQRDPNDSISGLTANTYYVTVTDGSGCTAADSAVVAHPTFVSTTSSSTPPNGNDGTATVVAAGGTPPYTYSWNTTPAQTTATATGLAVGSYSVTVTDNQGCTEVEAVTVAMGTAIISIADVVVEIYPNPAQEVLYIKSTEPVNIEIFNTLGLQLLSEKISGTHPLEIAHLTKGFILSESSRYQREDVPVPERLKIKAQGESTSPCALLLIIQLQSLYWAMPSLIFRLARQPVCCL